MYPCYEFAVMLVIRHPDADPRRLSHELGLEPEYSWRAGDTRPSATGADAHGKYRETYWAAKLYPYPESQPVPTYQTLFEAFGEPLGRIETPLESVLATGTLVLKRRRVSWDRLLKEGASGEFLVSLASRDRVSLKLPADLLATMASLDLSVSIDVAPCAVQSAA